MEDPRIAKLRELLAEANRLLNGANELVAELTDQLNRASSLKPDNHHSDDRRRKPRG